jgi:hypothetical protein
MLQIVAKCLITVFLVGVAVLASRRVWQADLDLGRLLSPRKALESSVNSRIGWLPTRDPSSLYQGAKVVAKVQGISVNESTRSVTFDVVYGAQGLDTMSTLEFRDMRLAFLASGEHHEWTSLYPDKGPVIMKVQCNILGPRPDL